MSKSHFANRFFLYHIQWRQNHYCRHCHFPFCTISFLTYLFILMLEHKHGRRRWWKKSNRHGRKRQHERTSTTTNPRPEPQTAFAKSTAMNDGGIGGQPCIGAARQRADEKSSLTSMQQLAPKGGYQIWQKDMARARKKIDWFVCDCMCVYLSISCRAKAGTWN